VNWSRSNINWFRTVYSKSAGINFETIEREVARWKRAIRMCYQAFYLLLSLSVASVVHYSYFSEVSSEVRYMVVGNVMIAIVVTMFGGLCLLLWLFNKEKNSSTKIEEFNSAWSKMCEIAGDDPDERSVVLRISIAVHESLRLQQEIEVLKKSGDWRIPGMRESLNALERHDAFINRTISFLDTVGILVHRGDLFHAASRGELLEFQLVR
jgi:hypothetical protein